MAEASERDFTAQKGLVIVDPSIAHTSGYFLIILFIILVKMLNLLYLM